MALRRIGALLSGVGLVIVALAAVLGSVACTEIACPGGGGYALAGVDAAGTITYVDACNRCRTPAGTAYGVGAIALGVVVGLPGVVGAIRSD